MMEQRIEADVILIGAGPIGLEMAVTLKRAHISYLHFERGQIGQTITWFPRLMRFFSSPGRIALCGVPIPRVDESKCTREEYLAHLRAIVVQFGLDVRTYTEVTSLSSSPDGGFRVGARAIDGLEESWKCRKVILATGDMHEPRFLGVPGEDLPHVSHYFEEPHKYFRRKVLIVGGKNSAAEAALRCHYCRAHVEMACRDAELDKTSIKYWFLPDIEGRIRKGQIPFHGSTRVVEIRPGRAVLESLLSGERQEVAADFVLLLTGYRADMGLFEMAGVRLEGPSQTPQFDEQTMETNVPGLFVAGTATAGSQQSYKVFIETCHIHVERIIAALTGAPPPEAEAGHALPES